jgi:ubiquinone/menaquinone biosynthesis C-methylase UbiE
MAVASNPIVETYSRLAEEYDDDLNIHSCWGKSADKALSGVVIKDNYDTVLDMGCGTGRAIAQFAQKGRSGMQWIGIDPAPNMCKLAVGHASGLGSLRILEGSFESIPLDAKSVDYIFSIFAFHWTTNLDASVKELKRVLKPNGDMDLFFIGRNNGREFIQATSPIFLKHMGPAQLLEVTETYETYPDTLEGHWAWWVRIEGQFMRIQPEKKKACDEEIKAALAKIGPKDQIPYTIHKLHVKVRQSK